MNNVANNLLNSPLLNQARRGFTLIEVMLAMAVFAIAGVALLGAAENNLRNTSNLEVQLFASWVASNQLVEANLDTAWPPKNNAKGKVELLGKEWFWQQKVIKTTDNNMRAIVVEVRENEKEELATTSLMSYVSKAEP